MREQITIRHLDDAAIEARYLAYEELISAGPVPVVIDLGRLIFLSAEIRQHAQTPRALRLLGALALVVRSPVTRVVAKFFRRLMGAPYPIRLFADEASAVEWALSQGEGAR